MIKVFLTVLFLLSPNGDYEAVEGFGPMAIPTVEDCVQTGEAASAYLAENVPLPHIIGCVRAESEEEAIELLQEYTKGERV